MCSSRALGRRRSRVSLPLPTPCAGVPACHAAAEGGREGGQRRNSSSTAVTAADALRAAPPTSTSLQTTEPKSRPWLPGSSSPVSRSELVTSAGSRTSGALPDLCSLSHYEQLLSSSCPTPKEGAESCHAEISRLPVSALWRSVNRRRDLICTD